MKVKMRMLTPEQNTIVLSVARIVQRVCLLPNREAYKIAKSACVFHVPKRYAGGKTAARGYE